LINVVIRKSDEPRRDAKPIPLENEKMSASSLAENKTLRILSAATRDGYGVVSPVVYNLSHIVGSIRAAERKRAPLILELFPWGVTSTDGLLVRAAAQAAAHASVPVSVHLDHATDEGMIRRAVADLPLDSIMVDMSHHARAENLARTGRLAALCRARGIAVEGEPGRIEGGEDGVAAAELEAVLTTAEDVDDFLAAGVDVLAPAIGNVHGAYGELGPRIDMARYDCSSMCLN
jgi:fructose-bisphosphate aldolase class II